MNPERFEWQTRCEFNAYCKHALRNELIDALRERKSRERREVNFSDLAPHEEKQLYTVDRYFVNEENEAFCAGGLKITAKLLADALHSLPKEKRQAQNKKNNKKKTQQKIQKNKKKKQMLRSRS